MQFVLFQNHNAIFDCELPEVIGHLKHYADQGVHEAREILETISSSPSSAIKIKADYFAYMVLDLIKADKGHVYCKACKEKYGPSQLTSIPLGFRKTPFGVTLKGKGGIIKRLFGKKMLICGTGGERYLCPHGHDLIGMITWTGMMRIPQ